MVQNTEHQASKKADDLLSPIQKKTYELMRIYKTVVDVAKKLKKDRRIVARDVSILEKKGYLIKKSPGWYDAVADAHGVVAPEHQGQDIFRLHNLHLRLRMNSSERKHIRTIVLKDELQYKVKYSQAGIHFIQEVMGTIGQEYIDLIFPSDFSIYAKTFEELNFELYSVIEKTVRTWERKFKIFFFKNGRVNFDIRNVHVALMNNGIAKESKKWNENQFILYDNNDGKPRIVIDWSNGIPELEGVHPQKALPDSSMVKEAMNDIVEGKYSERNKVHDGFFEGKASSLNMQEILKTFELQLRSNLLTSQSQQTMAKQMEQMAMLLHMSLLIQKPKEEKDGKDTKLTNYFS